MQKKVRLLGFVVDEKGIRVDKSKCTNVANWPIPRSKKQIQQFMGLVNYLRTHIPMIYRVAAPLTDLIKDNKDVVKGWTESHTKCFEAIKKILQADLLLNYPDFAKEFVIACDASLYGVAAVIYQEDDKGRHKYVGFISSTLSPSQRRWSTTKRELYAIVLALKKFKTYVYGRSFRIMTDHRALVYLHSQKMVNPMMAGWIETLLDFNFEVIHLPGAMNIFPDLLSRLYPPIEIPNTRLLLEESETKSKLRSKANFLRRKDGKMVRKVKYSHDRSLNIFATQVVENKKEDLDYMTPPDEDRDGILQEIHQFGHFGAQAIVREVHSQGLHWTNVYDEAKKLVSSCPECQKHNISKRGWHPLKNVVSLQPMSHCSVDLAGPLTPTLDGHVYVMVLTDICTKYIIVRPLKTKESTSVARELIKVFGDYSFPIVLQSDHGSEFENALLQSISANLGIQRNYSTPYAPRGNGIAEASVKITMNTLRKMCRSNAREWSDYLPLVQLSINRYVKSKSQTSPFSLMFARRVTLPDDYAHKDKYPIPKDIMSIEELEERIDYMHNIVFPAINEREKKINEIMRKRFDDNHMLVDIPVGAHVMVKVRQRPSKLSPIYDGPYTVIRRNQGGSYELKDEMNEILHRNYVPSELKVVNVDEKAIDDEYFEIEAIRDHRGKAANREYLIKWKGYGERMCSWITADDVSDPHVLQLYWKKHVQLQKQEEERILKRVSETRPEITKKRRVTRTMSRKRASPTSTS
jgi:ribonuclease HI